MTQTFFVEFTDFVQLSLRRYSSGSKCQSSGVGYCTAMVPVKDKHPVTYTEDGSIGLPPDYPKDDPRWPKNCSCGREFSEDDARQVFQDQVMVRIDTGEEFTLRKLPPGAVYDARWCHDIPTMCGPDGRSIQVICPDGKTWAIDSRASNCTMRDDDKHKCWVRHGKPEDNNLTVDKNGPTCGAGGGSIDTGTYHGFLREGKFT